jgi:hypothetical protein
MSPSVPWQLSVLLKVFNVDSSAPGPFESNEINVTGGLNDEVSMDRSSRILSKVQKDLLENPIINYFYTKTTTILSNHGVFLRMVSKIVLFSIISVVGLRKVENWYQGLSRFDILLDHQDFHHGMYGRNIMEYKAQQEFFNGNSLLCNDTLINELGYSSIVSKINQAFEVPCFSQNRNEYSCHMRDDISGIIKDISRNLKVKRKAARRLLIEKPHLIHSIKNRKNLKKYSYLDIHIDELELLEQIQFRIIVLQARQADASLRLARSQALASLNTCEDLLIKWRNRLVPAPKSARSRLQSLIIYKTKMKVSLWLHSIRVLKGGKNHKSNTPISSSRSIHDISTSKALSVKDKVKLLENIQTRLYENVGEIQGHLDCLDTILVDAVQSNNRQSFQSHSATELDNKSNLNNRRQEPVRSKSIYESMKSYYNGGGSEDPIYHDNKEIGALNRWIMDAFVMCTSTLDILLTTPNILSRHNTKSSESQNEEIGYTASSPSSLSLGKKRDVFYGNRESNVASEYDEIMRRHQNSNSNSNKSNYESEESTNTNSISELRRDILLNRYGSIPAMERTNQQYDQNGSGNFNRDVNIYLTHSIDTTNVDVKHLNPYKSEHSVDSKKVNFLSTIHDTDYRALLNTKYTYPMITASRNTRGSNDVMILYLLKGGQNVNVGKADESEAKHSSSSSSMYQSVALHLFASIMGRDSFTNKKGSSSPSDLASIVSRARRVIDYNDLMVDDETIANIYGESSKSDVDDMISMPVTDDIHNATDKITPHVYEMTTKLHELQGQHFMSALVLRDLHKVPSIFRQQLESTGILQKKRTGIFEIIRFRNLWRVLFVASSAFAGIQTTRYSSEIRAGFNTAQSNAYGFFDRRIFKPSALIVNDVFLNKRVSLTDQEALKDSKRSLKVMLTDFIQQERSTPFLKQKSAQEIQNMIKEMDMSPISYEYETELKRPMQNIISGKIARLVLIQLQFVKKELLVAMQAIDELFNANQVNLQLMAVTPAIFGLMFIQTIGRTTYNILKASSRGRLMKSSSVVYASFRAVIKDIERLLVLSPNFSVTDQKVNVLSNVELGRLLSLLYRLHSLLLYNSSYLNTSQLRLLQDDLRELLIKDVTITQRLALIDRTTRYFSFLQSPRKIFTM